MKAFLPRILALALVATTASINAAADPEANAAGQISGALLPRPVAPVLDNLTPAQAELLNSVYWKCLDDWEKAQPSKGKELARLELSEDQRRESDSDESVSLSAPKPPAIDWRQPALRIGMSESTRAKLESDGLAIL